MPIMGHKIVPDSIVYSDSWKGYNVPDVSALRHFRINHSELFATNQNHINGIENFWNQAKHHMRKFNRVPKVQFGLFLKECEWRFNNSNPLVQLSHIKQWVTGTLDSYLGQPLLYLCSLIITLLFAIMFSTIGSLNMSLFGNFGLVSAYPDAFILIGSIPVVINFDTTAAALAADNSQFEG